MIYPRISEINTSREMVDVFRGYNHNLRIRDGEFYDMKNLSSDAYPILTTRKKRGVYLTSPNIKDIISKTYLCYIDGLDFVICRGDTEERHKVLIQVETSQPRQLVAMGAYVIILPDKRYINIENPEDKGSIDQSLTETSGVTFEPCRADGTVYDITSSDTPPSNPNGGEAWYEPKSKVLREYSSTTEEWIDIYNTYVKISAIGLSRKFETGDAVKISGITLDLAKGLNNTSFVIKKHLIQPYMVVQATLDLAYLSTKTQEDVVTFERKMPDMDFIVESENRLWGCKYGINADGELVNEIYASKLGDFKNWNYFAGISTDSYAASVGTDGKFTGATTYLGHPIFFKENCMHKVYGNYPANFQIQTTTCRGVQPGCDKSIATVNETLFYKSLTGVCVYDGSLPSEISMEFGEERYHDAVAGALGNKYYISMKDEKDESHLFVYDAAKGLWHKEDNTQVVDFCTHKGELYYIDYADKLVKTVRGTGVTETEPIKWEAVTGILGTDSPDKKYISRIDVRMSLPVGSRVIFSAEYDSSGEWEHLFTMAGTSLKSFPVPVKPKRCDHLRLKFEGEGEAKIFSICKTIEEGSDT